MPLTRSDLTVVIILPLDEKIIKRKKKGKKEKLYVEGM